MEFPLNETSLMIFCGLPIVQSIELLHRVSLKPKVYTNKLYLVRAISPTFIVVTVKPRLSGLVGRQAKSARGGTL